MPTESTSKSRFPHVHAEELTSLMSDGGPEAVIEFIAQQEDDARRLQLFQFAQGHFGAGELDDLVDVVEAGIDEALAQAEAARDQGEEARADALTDVANVLSYNLSADLADCWPGDARGRELRHHELGLEAADLCLDWRRQLGKGPLPFYMAWWAKGMHLLSLGRVADAQQAFEESLRHGFAHCADSRLGTDVDARGDWTILLGAGYLEIARAKQGHSRAGLDRALNALDDGAASRPKDADDLRFAASQLRTVMQRYL